MRWAMDLETPIILKLDTAIGIICKGSQASDAGLANAEAVN